MGLAIESKTVTDIAVSGDRSLRFELPGNSTASFGDFEHNFTPDSENRGNGPYPVQFGNGEEFYVRWRQRFSPEALIEYQANSGGDTGSSARSSPSSAPPVSGRQ